MGMSRMDIFPTHEYRGYLVRYGSYLPYGASIVPGGINFSIYSYNATFCVLVVFQKGDEEPFIEIPFQGVFTSLQTRELTWADFRIGKLFTMTVFGLNYEEIEYGFRFSANLPKTEAGRPGIYRFDESKILLDPYAKEVGGRDVWRKKIDPASSFPYRGRLIQEDYDWNSDRQLEIPMEDLIIYELHVRGFTQHPSSKVNYPGTFNGIYEKIPYLKQLGINCIELMPIAEFDEYQNSFINPFTLEPLTNYWGYNPINFFSPKAAYAACGKTEDATMVADELKTLIKALHKNGIEVILDVVFNHTAEGNEYGPTISFRGIDNSTYYMLTPQGEYYNFSGTGNTLNCNNPIVRNLLLDCLHYWVVEYHIDGFRFDLASILGRDSNGYPMSNPPLLESLSFDPILAKCKLIAESWDAAGLYQVGSFPAYSRWAEWNGQFRDIIRKFIKGDFCSISWLDNCLQGSPDLYQTYGQAASVNFITCHDGFTLWDLVSYNQKHNEANGENNQDGVNNNESWNCGHEGPTNDPSINALRKRQIKNFIAILLVSKGVPMIHMGDEMGRTQKGNNNAYCQDNEISWLNWNLLNTNSDIFRFFKFFISLRMAHPILRSKEESDLIVFPQDREKSHTLSFLIQGINVLKDQSSIFVAVNMHWIEHSFEIPPPKQEMIWHLLVNTGQEAPLDILENDEVTVNHEKPFTLEPKTICIFIERKALEND